MVGEEDLPRLASRTLSLNSYMVAQSRYVENRRKEANRSGSDDSFGSFIRSRKSAVGFTQATDKRVLLNDEYPARQPRRRSSTGTELANGDHLPDIRRRRSFSPVQGAVGRPTSFRRRRRSNSPVNNKGRKTSKSPKRKSKSPAPEGSGSDSSMVVDERKIVPKSSPLQKRGKLKAGKGSPRKKSPRPRRRGSLEHSTVKEGLGGSFPDLGVSPSSITRKRTSDDLPEDPEQSVPPLVEDSVLRETLNGAHGGKEWNLLEDTPGGHVPIDDFKIVNGVECRSDDALSWRPGSEEDEELEEDDDICDDPGEIDDLFIQNSLVRRKSMPADPTAPPGLRSSGIGKDRFNPDFNNSDMWRSEHSEMERTRCESGDVSLLNDHVEYPDDIEDLPPASDYEEDVADVESNKQGSSDNVRTPATTKRRGGRRRVPPKAVSPILSPNLDELSGEDEPNSKQKPERAENRRKSKRKTKDTQSSRESSGARRQTSDREKSQNARSSPKRKPASSRSKIGRPGRRPIPEEVPTTPMGSSSHDPVRSPMSSSLTSTPNSSSIISSTQTNQQQKSLAALRMNSFRRRKNKPLNLHVDNSFTTTEDEHSLGASTLTTNFSTTNRTRGDNTVSTRSLFQSERMNASHTLRLPQRRRANSDSDHDGGEKQGASTDAEIDSHPPSMESEILHLSKSTIASSLSGRDGVPILLKRPSGEGPDFLRSDSDRSETSSAGSSLEKWREETGQGLISPKASFRKQKPSPGRSEQFLQLNTSDHGVVVESEVSAAADLSSPLDIAGSHMKPLSSAAFTTTPVDPIPELADEGKLSELRVSESTSATSELAAAMGDIPEVEEDSSDSVKNDQEPPSPVELKKRKKGGKLGLLRRAFSRKGQTLVENHNGKTK